MALDREDMERRRKKREAARRMQQRWRRRMLLLTACALVVLVGCGVAIFKLASGDKTTPVSSVSETAATTAATTAGATKTGAGPAVIGGRDEPVERVDAFNRP